MACAAALGNLISLSKINFLKQKEKEDLFFNILNSWKKKYPNRVKYIFGKGMIYGVLIYKKTLMT